MAEYIRSENIHRNKQRIWGSFRLNDGSVNKFEMRKGESWFQWGNTTDNLYITVERIEQLCNDWLGI